MCGKGFLDTTVFGKVLMKLGLALLVVGHLNFIVGAIVHGLVLRHVIKLQDMVSLQYSITNTLTVVSAILSLSCGIATIVLSQYLTRRPLSTSLCLWAISIFLDIMEVVFSIRLLVKILQLLELKVCSRTKVTWQLSSEEGRPLNNPVELKLGGFEENSCL